MFDRYDICDAYYVFGMLWHGGQGSKAYGYLSRLALAGYRPGSAAEKGKLLTENARAIYRNLCKEHGC